MSNDAEQPNDASAKQDAEQPVVHTATLSEPKAKPGEKTKKSKKERPEPETAMGKLWYNWVKPIGTVIIIVVVFRSMLLDWNDVPTGSMEPEIHVGDRIAVNRLAYGLQFPLTGPQIGIPFTPVQFDNPLDGIPQIAWGSGPQRGDIVTFWNPVTDVRMVKRIVAVPGDTIEMRGGQLTINDETATYTELDAVVEELPLQTKYQRLNSLGKSETVREDLDYQSESLLELTRTVQHIKKNWVADITMLTDPLGRGRLVEGETITVTEKQLKQSPIDPTRTVEIEVDREVPLEDYLRTNPGVQVQYRIKDGAPYIGDNPVSYNEFATLLLKRYESGQEADLLDKIGLAVQGHQFMVDGQATFNEQFRLALNKRSNKLSNDERQALSFSFTRDFFLLRELLGTSFGPYTVPEDSYLMIGDNRNNSSDGRHFGPVKKSEITGKAFAVAFSFEDNKMFALPPDPAWNRFFKDLD